MSLAREWLKRATARLKQAAVDSPSLSAQLILAHVLSMDRERMYLELRSLGPTQEQLQSAEQLLARREQGEPVAYLLGQREFYGLDFAVDKGVLIPRPESELLVEQGIQALKHHSGKEPVFADLGTGSGALAICLAVHAPAAKGLALDLSPEALAVARANGERHGVLDRLAFIRGDFAQCPLAEGSLDLVLANPPYVTPGEYKDLSREVREFEPKTALVPQGDPGDGLKDIRAISLEAWRVLGAGGSLFMELGCSQGQAGLHALAQSGDWEHVEVLEDLAGLDRVLLARKRAWGK